MATQSAYRTATWLMLLLVVLLTSGSSLSAQARRLPARKPKPTLTLTNPVSKARITFHDLSFFERTLQESAWRRLTVHLPDTTYTVRLGKTDAYMLYPEPENLWSTDGRYLLLYSLYNVYSKDDYTRQVLVIFSLESGNESYEISNWGTVGHWVKDKPHTVVSPSGEVVDW